MSDVFTAYELAAYKGSRDYAQLVRLARQASILCIVDFQGQRDVARTNFMRRRRDEEIWSVSARGMGYITAFNEADFIALCEHNNLEFIAPPSL